MKIGLYGGTFDPFHNGHQAVLRAAKEFLDLDKLFLIPAGDPPHKTDKEITGKAHRLAMIWQVAASLGAEVSTWEMDRGERSYSVDTVTHFKNQYPDDEFYFIIGADSFRNLPDWWHYEELLSECFFLVVSRPDVPKSTLLEKYTGLEKPPRVFFLDGVYFDISSTDIRNKVKNGEDISALVPETVATYIAETGLYKR